MKVHSDVAGQFKIEAFKPDLTGKEIEGTRRTVADWFPNLITDGGLEYMATNSGYLNFCQVGSGSTTPTNSDTSLAAKIAHHNTTQTQTSGAQSTEPYFAWARRTYRFNEGVAAGNLAEVGIGWGNTGNLFSRALILDSNGDPTTITILSDEVLDVTYELRVYPPLTDFTDSVTFTGNIGGTYDWTTRASFVTSSFSWGPSISGTSMGAGLFAESYSGAIGPITGGPSGTSGSYSDLTTQAYSANSLERRININFGLNAGNIAGGIRSIYFGAGHGRFQTEFDPPIPKTASDNLTLTVYHSWGRKT